MCAKYPCCERGDRGTRRDTEDDPEASPRVLPAYTVYEDQNSLGRGRRATRYGRAECSRCRQGAATVAAKHGVAEECWCAEDGDAGILRSDLSTCAGVDECGWNGRPRHRQEKSRDGMTRWYVFEGQLHKECLKRIAAGRRDRACSGREGKQS